MRRFALVLALVAAASARADVAPHPLFSDGMVLQQKKPCPVWGTAQPDEAVVVTLKLTDSDAVDASAKADKDGKWKAVLPLDKAANVKAGGPYALTIKGNNTIALKDVYVGEVWVGSGQSNMEWSVNASHDPMGVKDASQNPMIRLFTVRKTTAATPQTTVPVGGNDGRWFECGPKTVGSFSAVAYHFGKHLQKELGVPVGLIHCSWGGTRAEAWTSRPILEAIPEYKGEYVAPEQAQANFAKAQEKYKEDLEKHKKAVAKAKDEGVKPPAAPRPPVEASRNPNAASALYNGMLAPIIPYGIQGVIWYQGESNAGKAMAYRSLFPTMIKNWRDDWKQGDFPFLFVQLAPFMKIETQPTDPQWAHLRDAQRHTEKTVKNTAMAVITDVGNETDIHPKQKEPVGQRLALAALALSYGRNNEYSGPRYEKMTTEGSRAVLHFSHLGGGLVCKGEKLTGFTIAGSDKKFHNAEAEIVGDTVVVSCKEVEKPAAVRFGWANYPVVNLWNKAGLPASPFRTDE